MYKNNKVRVFSILSIFIPPTIVLGSFIPDLLLSIIAIWFLCELVKSSDLRKVYTENVISKLLIIVFFLLILSSLLSNDKLYSLKNSLFLFRFYVFALALAYLLSQNEKLLNYFFLMFLFLFILLTIDALVQYIYNYNFLRMPKTNWARLSGLFGDEYILGSFLSRFFLLFYGLWFLQNKTLKIKNFEFSKYILTFFALFITYIVFLTGERTAVSIMIINLIFVFIISEIKIHYKAILIITCFVISVYSINENNKLKKRYIETIDKVSISKYLAVGDRSHHNLQNVGIDIFKENLFFGVGPKLYRKWCKKYEKNYSDFKCENHPHNLYIQVLSEGGLFVFIFFIHIYFKFAIKFIKKIFNFKKDRYNKFFLAILCNILINFNFVLPSGSIFNNKFLLITTFSIGFLIFLTKKLKIRNDC